MSSPVKTRGSASAENSAGQGFTLIELLIALTLLGLVLSLLLGGFRFGISAWESGGHRMARSNQISAVQDLLRSEISQARMLLIGSSRSKANRTFKGSLRELVFTAPLPAHMGAGGYYLFSLHAREIRGRLGLALVRRIYRPDMFAAGHDEHGEEAVLLADSRRRTNILAGPTIGATDAACRSWSRFGLAFPPGSAATGRSSTSN